MNNPSNIILFSLGSRGDMEPFLTIGEMLKNRGYSVICSMPEQFRKMVEETGLRFHGLSSEFLIAQEKSEFKKYVEGKGFFIKRIMNGIKIYKESKEIMVKILAQQHELVMNEKPDVILYSAKCSYAMLWGMANPGKSAMVCPKPCIIHKVNEHPPIGVKINLGKAFNRWMYDKVNSGIARYMNKETREYHNKYPHVHTGKEDFSNFLVNKEKLIYTFSPSVFKRPDYWPENAKVLGYREREKTNNWTPSAELLKFVNLHNKILFITFGSMSTNDPEYKTALFINAINKLGIPAIINRSWGGLVSSKEVSGKLIFVNEIPYEWIFPKVYAVIHHGGAGTTHAALKYGCATMALPHCFDQFFWNDIITGLHVGPKGISIKKINEKIILQKVSELWHKQEYKHNAKKIADEMVKENFEEEIIDFIKK